jgi:putative NADH-flavin reductase
MHITVFGASGRTGIPFVRQALAAGHAVTAFVRDPAKLPIEEQKGLTVVTGDAYTGEGVVKAVRGADTVVSVLGQSSGGPDDLLEIAGEHMLAAMSEHEVTRFVTLVGAGVREEGESVSFSGRVMGAALKLLAGEVLADAAAHVERVKASDTDWTVVRAPRLTDDDATGYRHGDIALGFEAVARADVAAFILECLEDDLYVGAMPKVGPE